MHLGPASYDSEGDDGQQEQPAPNGEQHDQNGLRGRVASMELEEDDDALVDCVTCDVGEVVCVGDDVGESDTESNEGTNGGVGGGVYDDGERARGGSFSGIPMAMLSLVGDVNRGAARECNRSRFALVLLGLRICASLSTFRPHDVRM
eukprot:CAMPEP_0170181650 /NCGR_PEP_ID=MMETSP0040_2-20121228/25660_1 /TAXON_ID=641309 /ORGANISM="Lotharella oceanica, Strain CCMP622" /LENGTH=147 /DNA_ID=CAMNT_0010426775 /DNA_START=344 /DNA_END=785 /DNA_ORIENTATION=+